MGLTIPLKFINQGQEDFFNIVKRNSAFSGGYGNGKSYAGSMKALVLLGTFPRYRVVIARYSVKDLKRSTMSTFYKICPPELYDESRGGKRADSLEYLRLINGSEVFWMHLDDADEATVRGLETNSVLVDQAEQVSENMYLHLNARVGRWDQAQVPQELLTPDWPHKCKSCGAVSLGSDMCCQNPDKYPRVPAYMMLLCNPDSELHWIYRRYHEESLEFQDKYHKNHEMISAASCDNPALDQELLDEMLSNDPVWVRRYYYGIWGIPGGSIHEVPAECILRGGVDVSLEFISNACHYGKLYRVLDHGDSSPTCCLWFCAYKEWFFCYREYYEPDKLISDHRHAIDQLSKHLDGSEEQYAGQWADPQIFKKTMQRLGGFWSVADEYSDSKLDAPKIYWNPADNNELSTRNRINEALRSNAKITHPVKATSPAPKFYLIQKSPVYQQGCFHAISQLKSQKREQVGTENGKPIFSDERADITDHAYDPIRYFFAMHPSIRKERVQKPKAGSFLNVRNEYLKLKKAGSLELIYGKRRFS